MLDKGLDSMLSTTGIAKNLFHKRKDQEISV